MLLIYIYTDQVNICIYLYIYKWLQLYTYVSMNHIHDCMCTYFLQIVVLSFFKIIPGQIDFRDGLEAFMTATWP